MTRNMMLKKTVSAISRLPENKLAEVADFVDFLLRKQEDNYMQKGIEELAVESGALDFLNEEEELYSVSDVKEKYH